MRTSPDTVPVLPIIPGGKIIRTVHATFGSDTIGSFTSSKMMGRLVAAGAEVAELRRGASTADAKMPISSMRTCAINLVMADRYLAEGVRKAMQGGERGRPFRKVALHSSGRRVADPSRRVARVTHFSDTLAHRHSDTAPMFFSASMPSRSRSCAR
jgi:hypothetical protein